MRLATLRRGGRDGTLALVHPDGTATLRPGGIPTLQAALDDWAAAEPVLRDDPSGEVVELDPSELHAPLPRAYHWVDGSTFLAHMERARAARGAPLPPNHDSEPMVYQAGSDGFLAPTDPIELPDEAWGLDLEATVAVVTDDVPRGTAPDGVPDRIRLVLLANDLTYRNLIPGEVAKGFGIYLSKPARPLAPFALTPDELGDAWDGRLLHATLRTWVNGEPLGALRTDEDCAFDFAVLVAHLVRTRRLGAGTIVGSGTVANRDERRGFGALAEKRAVEITANGSATTPLLGVGDRVRVEAFDGVGRSLFGAIDQTVVG